MLKDSESSVLEFLVDIVHEISKNKLGWQNSGRLSKKNGLGKSFTKGNEP